MNTEKWGLDSLNISNMSLEDAVADRSHNYQSDSNEDRSFGMLSTTAETMGITENHNSVSTISGTQREASIDFTSAGFLESWSNVNTAGFLGTTSHGAFSASYRTRQSSTSSLPTQSGASFNGFGVLEHATFSRTLSSPTGPYRKDNYGVSSVIHDAARLTDWDMVLELCETHPQAAAYSGHDGWTALHQACNKRCPRVDVIKALINAYPAALLQEEVKSWLPLHLACRFKAPKAVVRLLLHMYPESGRIAVQTTDKQKRRPLYYAIRYDAPDGVAGLLLQVDPSAVLEEDQNEDSPLALVWDSWAEKLEGKRIVQPFLPGGFPEPEESSVEQRAILLRQRLEKEPKLKKRWDQVNMLLKAAFRFPFEAAEANSEMEYEKLNRNWRIVHATAATKCHLSLFLLACALHPEQARELAECDLRRPTINGNSNESKLSSSAHQTALHLASSSNAGGETGKTVIVSLLRLYREAAQEQDGIDGSLPLHRMVENHFKDWPNHSAILYHFYPRAVQILDRHGKLPLHRAACTTSHYSSDHDEDRSVIIQLVRSYPQAAGIADESGCLPIHYAVMNAMQWDIHVEAIFNSNRNAVQVRAGLFWDQRLPIHMAAANTLSQDSLIQRLIHLHPRGAAQEDRGGMLPLHIACEHGKDWTETRYIYDAFPSAVCLAERNSRGWLPLHMAAACLKTDGELIEKITENNLDAAFICDSEGRYPLHLACSAGKNWEGGLRVLFDANPAAVAVRDCHGFLPVHICALSFCKEESDKPKTKAVPMIEAKKERTVNHEEAAQLDILFNLFRSDPTTIQ
jgi:ankyrin repeat protein